MSHSLHSAQRPVRSPARGKSIRRQIRKSRVRALLLEPLEQRALLATLDFTGNSLAFNATPGVSNDVTISVSDAGKKYTFDSQGEQITAVTNLPAGCVVTPAVLPANVVTIDCGVPTDVTDLTVNVGDLDDIVNVQSVAVPTTVNGDTGNDTINVSSDAPTNSGNLDGIAAPLAVNGGLGTDTLNVSDAGGATANANVILAATQIQNFAGPTDNITIDYATIDTLNVFGNSFSETFSIQSPSAATTLNAGGGADIITVVSTAAALTVNAASGADTVTVVSTTAPLIVNGNDGNDVLNVRAIGAAATVNGDADNDTINVSSDAPTNSGSLDGIAAALAVNGGTGNDTLNVSDAGGATSNTNVILAATQIQNFAGPTDNVTIDYGTIDTLNVTGDSQGETFSVQSPGAALTLNAGAGNDTLNVRSITVAATVNGQADNDTINVSSDAPTNNGNLDGIAAALSVNGGTGSDTLNVSDAGGATSNTNVVLTATQIQNFAGAADNVTIDYATIDTLNVTGNANGETYSVQSPGAVTTLNAGGGADTVTVVSTTATLTVNGGSGGDVVSIQAIGAAATVNGDADNDTVTVASTAATLTVNGGSGADVINVRAIGAATTVNGDADNDTINVSSDAPTNNGNLDGIAAALSVNGGTGSDTLNVSDAGGATSNANVILTATQIQNFAGPADNITIDYATIDTLNVTGNSNGETYSVQSPGAALTLNAGAGNDTLNVRSVTVAATVNGQADNDTINVSSDAPANNGNLDGIAAALAVNGGTGSDTLNVSDAGGATSNTNVILAATQIRNFAGAADNVTIDYGTIDTLNVTGNANNETYSVQSPGAATTLNAGGGLDTVTVVSTTATLIVNGGAGDDVVNIRAISAAATVNGGADNDTINVSSDAPTNNGDLDGIGAALAIHGDGGAINRLFISDASGATAHPNVILGATQIQNFAAFPIDYATIQYLIVTGNNTGETFSIQSPNAATIFSAGGGADTVTVVSTTATLTVNADAGKDVINVQAIGVDATVNGGADDDTINVSSDAPDNNGNLDGIGAALAIHGDGGASNRLNVSDAGGAAAHPNVIVGATQIQNFAAFPIDYATIQYLTVTGNSTGETFSVESPGAALTLNAGAGSDVVNVRAVSAAATINGGDDNDTINVSSDAPTNNGNLDGIAAALAVNGGNGSDTLNVSDAGGATSNTNVILAATQIQNFAGPTDNVTIDYSTIDMLNVTGNANNETFSVQSPSAITTLNTGGGDDTVTVASTTATLTVNGGAGADAVTVVSTAATLTVNGGSGSDVINVRAIGASATVNGDADDDTINVSSDAPVNSGNLDGIAAALAVNGGSDIDTLNVSDAGGTTANANVVLTATQIWNFAGPADNVTIDYATIENLTLTGNANPEGFRIDNTAPDSATSLRMMGGKDRLIIVTTGGDGGDAGDLGSSLTVDGGTGNDVIVMQNNGIKSVVNLNGDDGEDQITALRTASGAQNTINGGADNDFISIGDATHGLNLIESDVTVDGGGNGAQLRKFFAGGSTRTLDGGVEHAGLPYNMSSEFVKPPEVDTPTGDRLEVHDDTNSGNPNYSVTATAVNRVEGNRQVNYGNIELLELTTSRGNDLVDVYIPSLPSSLPTVLLVDGHQGTDDLVRINGTAQDNRFVTLGNANENNDPIPGDLGPRKPFELRNVERTNVFGQDGDDVLYNTSTVASLMDGAGGNDIVCSAPGHADMLIGGPGVDFLCSAGGGTILLPDAQLIGNSLFDVLPPQDGEVIILGGTDTVLSQGIDYIKGYNNECGSVLINGPAQINVVCWLKAKFVYDNVPVTSIGGQASQFNSIAAAYVAPPAPSPILPDIQPVDPAAISGGESLLAHNFAIPCDVTGDQLVTPLDVLVLINTLNMEGPRSVTPQASGEGEVTGAAAAQYYYDVSGDNFVTALDALTVINWLNAQAAASEGPVAEGELAVPAVALGNVESNPSLAGQPALGLVAKSTADQGNAAVGANTSKAVVSSADCTTSRDRLFAAIGQQSIVRPTEGRTMQKSKVIDTEEDEDLLSVLAGDLNRCGFHG